MEPHHKDLLDVGLHTQILGMQGNLRKGVEDDALSGISWVRHQEIEGLRTGQGEINGSRRPCLDHQFWACHLDGECYDGDFVHQEVVHIRITNVLWAADGFQDI